jgi:hypothetical protein
MCSCRAIREDAEGCRDVTSGLQGAGLQLSLDPDRELERIHSLFAAHLHKIDTLQGGWQHRPPQSPCNYNFSTYSSYPLKCLHFFCLINVPMPQPLTL